VDTVRSQPQEAYGGKKIGRPKREQRKSAVSLRLPQPIFDALQAYSRETGIPKSFIVSKATVRYLEEMGVITGNGEKQAG
jgi:Ribbon-helix-helix domain